jgi:hypothetical protein
VRKRNVQKKRGESVKKKREREREREKRRGRSASAGTMSMPASRWRRPSESRLAE